MHMRFASRLHLGQGVGPLHMPGAHAWKVGVLLLHPPRGLPPCDRYGRFMHAFEALDQLESLGLRVPAFVVAGRSTVTLCL